MSTTIESYYHKEVLTVDEGEAVAAAVAKMAEAEMGAVVVTKDGDVSGIFSERDVLKRVVAAGLDAADAKVGDVATKNVVTVDSSTTVKQCAALIRDRHIRHLPVVDGGKAVGIISARDFFDRIASRLEDLVERVAYDEQLRDNLDPYDHLGGSYGQ